jgi:hypothetical protein
MGVSFKPYVYIIGSLRQNTAPEIAKRLRAEGYPVFDDWYAAGPHADDAWQQYEREHREHSFQEALAGEAARHIFEFDLHHLSKASIVVLALPAGKSGHLEFGWAMGKGKKGYIVLDGEPERYDVMYLFASAVVKDVDELVALMEANQ